jgi:chromosome segregation ATPase
MNAVLTGDYDFNETEPMPMNEKDEQPIQLVELRVNLQHVQSDVSDMKVELRATNQRIDALSDKMDHRFDKLQGETNQRFDKLQGEMDQRFDKLQRETSQRFDKLQGEMDQRFDKLTGQTDERFDKVDERFDKVDARFDKVDARIDRVEEKVNDILIKLESWKVWAIGLYAALAGSMFYVMAKGFRWL